MKCLDYLKHRFECSDSDCRMRLSVAYTFASNMNVTTPKSARKRTLFSGRPTVESDDESLSPTSPLSSSPDCYSSHPSSTQWNMETPPRQCVASQFPIGPVQRQTESLKSRLCLFDLYASSVQKLPLNKTKDIRGQHKGNMGPVTNVELVEESPMKGPIEMSLLTPFKCLAGKDRQNETPKQISQKLVFEESPDIVSATAPVKTLQKSNPNYEADTVLTHFHAFTGVNKLRSIPASLFYHSTHARAALFPEPSSMSRNTVSSVMGSKKHKQLSSVESYSQTFCLSRSKTHMAKRCKMDEINVGVYHRIKTHKKKLTYKHPVDTAQHRIMPEDRIQSYLDKVAQSITGTKKSVHNEKDVHFIPSHSIQPCLTSSRMKSSSSPLTPNTMEPICPASPLPYPDKVAQSITDTKKSVPNEKDVHFTPSTVEMTRPASPLPDPPRKFFKFPPVWKSKTSATVTVNKNIKLVSFCSFKYTGQLNLRSKYETCPIVICNMDCKVSSFIPRIITRLHECYQLL